MPRWFIELLPPWLCVALGIGLVASTRGPLLQSYQQPTGHEQVSLLLSPKYSVLFSLGHKEALADYLFANLLVHYGLSFREKARYEATYRYLDTITTLAPSFVRPYLYADTLLTMRPTPAVLEDYLDTRRLHERGEEALPSHQELWLVAGQFSAYLAPQRVPEPYAKEFRLKGARDLARTCELASNNANLPYGCIAAARLLNREGQREAMIRMLSRTLAVNDDPEIRRMALGYLENAVNERERDRYARRGQALEAVWRRQMPQVSRIMMSLLGPGPEVWKCAGLSAALGAGCETTWRDWNEVKPGVPANGG
jgi:hypothetical protein